MRRALSWSFFPFLMNRWVPLAFNHLHYSPNGRCVQARRGAPRSDVMHGKVYLPLLILLSMASLVFSGCARNPSVRKAEYCESGRRYFEGGKYNEAVTQYKNAVKIDPGYPEAHYQLAQCYTKLGLWNQAHAELGRTLELAPRNWKAHID